MIPAMTVRDRSRQATRGAIVGAAADLLVEQDLASLSIPAVSARCGVSVRTIYRYFPTKADLVEALAAIDDPATTAGPMPSVDGNDLHSWLTRGWSDDVQTPLLRAQLRTTAGVEIRRERRQRHRVFAYAVLDRWGIEAEGEAREALADLLLLLTGGAARFEMTDVLCSPVERASAAAAWAVEALLTHARGDRPLPDPSTEIVMQPPTEGEPAMTTANAILILTAVGLLFSGAVTGVFMSRIRLSQPDTPKYLRYAHLASYGQAPILLGVLVILGFSGMSAGFDTATAIVFSAGAVLLVIKDLVNWLAGTTDEFAEQTTGYKIALLFGPVHVVGLVMVAIAAITGLSA